MTSTFCVVMRISVNMRMKNSRTIDSMCMRKEINTRIVIYKKRYAKKGYCFLYFEHDYHNKVQI